MMTLKVNVFKQVLQALKTDIHRLLLTSVGFGVLLLSARIVYTGNIAFRFLLWNLFLAVIPYLISYCLTLFPQWVEKRWKFIALLVIWLLFIPNSFYILTDLFHLTWAQGVPLWYDLLLIVCFAWNALLFGILSVRQIEKIVAAVWGYCYELLFIFPVMFLNALGVYIGRYMRFNSWDIVSNPLTLISDIFDLILHPLKYHNAWGMTLTFSFFLTILYLTIKKISKAIW
jgi:uncharacterized membrane protein